MKNLCLSILLIATSCFSSNLFAHCQVPCGVYGDQNRFEQMLEDQTTEEVCKAMDITPNYLWVLLHRAREQLKLLLESSWTGENVK